MVIGQTPRLGDKEFRRIKDYIEKNVGIRLPDEKRILVESRLQKRLKKLKIHSFADYCTYTFEKGGDRAEYVELIDAITTNKTDFLREPSHFSFMIETALPELARQKTKISLWSAASSTGQEPYNLAMFMEEYNRTHPPLAYEVLATDINESVLRKAREAVYPGAELDKVPFDFKKRYFLKSSKPGDSRVKVKKHIREKVVFKPLNLMDGDYRMGKKFDIVFCRNVLIYFDRPNQKDVINRITSWMNEGGYLFLGHSESMAGMNPSLLNRASSIYKKK